MIEQGDIVTVVVPRGQNTDGTIRYVEKTGPAYFTRTWTGDRWEIRADGQMLTIKLRDVVRVRRRVFPQTSRIKKKRGGGVR